tara:strand:- start:1995 stop:2219 length:225 start_codon:yes stop_codon:yes gene_type:complete
MAFEHNENTATVFNNDKKSSEKHPDYTGKGKVGDELMEFAVWKKKSANGNDYMYMSWKKPSDKFNKSGDSKPGF